MGIYTNVLSYPVTLLSVQKFLFYLESRKCEVCNIYFDSYFEGFISTSIKVIYSIITKWTSESLLSVCFREFIIYTNHEQKLFWEFEKFILFIHCELERSVSLPIYFNTLVLFCSGNSNPRVSDPSVFFSWTLYLCFYYFIFFLFPLFACKFVN